MIHKLTRTIGALFTGILLTGHISTASAQWCDPLISDLMLSTCECKHPFPGETGWVVVKDKCLLVHAKDCAGSAQYKDISGPIPTPRDTVGCEMVGASCVPKASAFTGAGIVISINNCHIATADDCTGSCDWEKSDPPFRWVSDSACELKTGGGGGVACMPE